MSAEKQTRKGGRPKGSKTKPKWINQRVRVDTLPRRKVGRPPMYNSKLAQNICMEVATTARGIDEICEANSKFPKSTTIYRWLIHNPEFRGMMDAARKSQLDLLQDQIIPISDTPKVGQVVTLDRKGEVIERKASDMIEHRKLQIETRKWMLSKLLPKKFGDSHGNEPASGMTAIAISVRYDPQPAITSGSSSGNGDGEVSAITIHRKLMEPTNGDGA
jgi:hypothetical protein